MLFHYHVALERTASFPPRDEMDTIEAPDGEAALKMLPPMLHVRTPPGVQSVWIRVIATWHEVGGPKHVLSQQFDMTSKLN